MDGQIERARVGLVKQTMHVHISRTAGKSIRSWANQNAPSYQALKGGLRRFDPNMAWTYFLDWNPGQNPTGKLDFLMQKRGVTQEWYDQAFTFAIVRNSWDRLVSLYAYLSKRRSYKRIPRTGHFTNFDAFVRHVTNDGKGWTEQQLCKRGSGEYRSLQSFWLQWGVKFVGRYEHLDGDWRLLCMKVGLKHSPLPKQNASTHRDYREYYTPELQRMVKDYYADEIETYGFQFDGGRELAAVGSFSMRQQQNALANKRRPSRKIAGQRIMDKITSIIPPGKTVIDMGAGAGNAVRALHKWGYEALGLDSTLGIEDIRGGEVLWADLTGDCGRFHATSDWGLFTEVGEHVPRELESKMMDNVCAIPKEGIIASWARPVNRGFGHVNCQELDYVRKLFERRGWWLDADATAEYNKRQRKRKLYVFRRVQ